MLSDAEIRAFFGEFLPLKGRGFSLQLDPNEGVSLRGDDVVVGVFLIIFERDGTIRDVKGQALCLLGARQRNTRGLDALRLLGRCIVRMDQNALETLMPHDLFPTELLGLGLDEETLSRVMVDPRANRILSAAPDNAVLLESVTRAPLPCLASAEHEARLRAHPDDAAAYAVYADWLTERGDPRGELISVQLELETCSADTVDALRARERHLLHTFAWEWLGGLAWSPENEFAATWRRGFLRAVRLGTSRDSGLEWSGLLIGDHFRELSKLQGLALLERLEAWPSHEEAEAIARTGLPPGVTKLSLQAEQHPLGDLSQVWGKLGNVCELLLDGRSMTFGEVDLPSLTSFEAITRGFTRENLASLRRANWPRLERLVLCVGTTGSDGCDVEAADLGWVFDAENLPNVGHLGLAGGNTLELARLLVTSRILPRLKSLDLSRGDLDSEGARFLRDHHAAFAHLERLTLTTDRWRTDAVARPLLALGPHVELSDRFIPVNE